MTLLRKSIGGVWHSENLEELPDKISDDSILWVDAEDPTKAEVTQLKTRFGITTLSLAELAEEGRRSKIEEDEARVFCFVSFPNRENFISNVKTNWITLIAEKRWLISVHKGHSDITCEIYEKISSHGYSALALSPSTDILLYIFLDLITNEFFLISDRIHEKLQSLSNEAGNLFRERHRQLSGSLGLDIARSRDQVLSLRQSIGPLREVMGKITRGEFAVVSSGMLFRYGELYDRTISLIDLVNSHREEIHDIGDILINVQTLTTNNVVRILTIISAIFLPLTLIAGIYGTNFGRGFFVPGSNTNYGFYIMIAAMGCIAIGLISVFRRKGWI
ncbi:MAG TPA: magnesium transporter CorA family protein [Candidatus Nanoarchaeia archaeon]|nr:magnesium transporter CorA family protein [Candidatus Nanoarchaeia archaeon]